MCGVWVELKQRLLMLVFIFHVNIWQVNVQLARIFNLNELFIKYSTMSINYLLTLSALVQPGVGYAIHASRLIHINMYGSLKRICKRLTLDYIALKHLIANCTSSYGFEQNIDQIRYQVPY